MYINLSDVKNQYSCQMMNKKDVIFGHPGRSAKIYYFSWNEFKPLWMPHNAQIMLTRNGGIRMVEYCGFDEYITRHELIEKKEIKLKHVKNMGLEWGKIYWFERCGRRKACVIVTKEIQDNERLLLTQE